jgi:hypothetical protein
MKWNWLFPVLLLLSSAGHISAQGYTTNELSDRKHRDFTGKLCLETVGTAKPLFSNPKIFNHIVTTENRCNERVTTRICYHGTDNCMNVEVPGHSRKEQILGVFPTMQLFRYDSRELF